MWGLAVHSDCDHVATVSDDKSLKIWSLANRALMYNLQLKKGARCVDYSPNGAFLAVGYMDGSFGVYKCPNDHTLDGLETIVEMHHRKEEISDIKFSPGI